MKVKKYAAATMPEVMKQIRNELGPEAVILNSRKVKHGGFLGLKKKSRIEVVAALDPQPLKENKQELKQAAASVLPDEKSKITYPNDHILNEIYVLKKMIHQSTSDKTKYPAEYQRVYMQLLEQEVEETVANKILDQVVKHHDSENIEPSYKRIQQDVKTEILNQLKNLSFQPISTEQKIVHFVGPTGVGKTTTIAKVAAERILKEGRKVAFITTDTYRIAAIEQLKTYAKILQVPVKVAYTKEDYIHAVHTFADYDYILVDTPGRNFREKKYVNALIQSINTDFSINMYLVLSLTAKSNDNLEIYDQFQHLPINQVIFTKADETRQYGSMLNMTLEKNMGIAYIANGQDVPDDLMEVTPELISDFVLGGIHDE
ncbi:flagellar biosynthesis protein FlhF [Virgibacillus oceani]